MISLSTMSRSCRRWIAVVAILAIASAVGVGAQEDSSTTMDILRDKLRADKKLLVAANLGLTDEEGKKFWPIYDEYQAELDGLNQRLEKTLMRYADAYNASTLTDDMAKSLMAEALEIDASENAMKKKYLDRLSGAVPAMKAVRYLQIESKIRAVIQYDLADTIPLVE